MTDLKTRVRMAWAVLRGRSVMYRWHATSEGMIPKTRGAFSIENTGLTKTSVDLTDEERRRLDAEVPPADPDQSEILDLTGDSSATDRSAVMPVRPDDHDDHRRV